MTVETRCARCGTVVDMRRSGTARVPRQMVPADYRLPDDHDRPTLAALFCAKCWPLR